MVRVRELTNWWRTKSLSSLEGYSRVRAIEKLAAAGYTDAVGPLIESLHDPIPEIREQIVDALMVLADPRAVPPLLEILLDERESVIREKLIQALQGLGAERCQRTLLEALSDDDAPRRNTAAWALRRLAWNSLDDEAKARIAIVQCDWSFAVSLGDAAIPALEEIVRDGTQVARREAAGALASIGSTKAFVVIRRLLNDRDAKRPAREVAAWAVRRMCWPDLRDEDVATALMLLGEWDGVTALGDAAIPALTDALSDLRARVRERAVESLAAIGGAEANEALLAVVTDDDQAVAVREAAAKALGDTADASTVPMLVHALNDKSWQVRVAAADALTRMNWQPATTHAAVLAGIARKDWNGVKTFGSEAVGPMVGALAFQAVCWDAARGLAAMEPEGVDALLGVLNDPTQPMACREIVSMVMADSGVTRAVAPLTEWLSSSDPELRQSAVATLERLGWTPDSSSDRAAVAIAHDDWSAVKGLGAAAIQPLIGLWRDGIVLVETLEALIRILEDASGRVSISHLRALVRQKSAEIPAASAGDAETITTLAARIHKLAKTELLRRGIMF